MRDNLLERARRDAASKSCMVTIASATCSSAPAGESVCTTGVVAHAAQATVAHAARATVAHAALAAVAAAHCASATRVPTATITTTSAWSDWSKATSTTAWSTEQVPPAYLLHCLRDLVLWVQAVLHYVSAYSAVVT
eukprot:2470577-Rhodomonas_salina.2